MRLFCFFLAFSLICSVQVLAQSAGAFSLPDTARRPAVVQAQKSIVEEKQPEASFVKPVTAVPAALKKAETTSSVPEEKQEETGFKLATVKKNAPIVQTSTSMVKPAVPAVSVRPVASTPKTSAVVPAKKIQAEKKVKEIKKTKVQEPELDENLSPAEKWLAVKGRLLLETLSLPSSTQKRMALTDLAGEVFRQKELARMVIGRRWGELNQQQQEEYVSLFVPFFVAEYGSLPLPVDGVSFRMGGVTPSGKDLLVKAEVDLGEGAQTVYDTAQQEAESFQKPDGSTVEVYFAVRNKNDSFYIRDVNVMGKSMVMVLRNMVEKMYTRAKTNPEEFLQTMRSRIEHEEKRLELLTQYGSNS